MIDINTPNARTQRILGTVFLVVGACLVYLFDVVPYQQMLAGADSIDLGLKRAIIGPLVALIGIGHLILGASAPVWFGRTERFNAKSIVLTVVFLAISFGVYWWLDSQLAAHGYT